MKKKMKETEVFSKENIIKKRKFPWAIYTRKLREQR